MIRQHDGAEPDQPLDEDGADQPLDEAADEDRRKHKRVVDWSDHDRDDRRIT